MKTYRSLSPEILAFTATYKVKGTRQVTVPSMEEGGEPTVKDEEVEEEKTVTVAMSQGTEADLPEENEHVKGLVIKGHLHELTNEELDAKNAPAEPKKDQEEEQA